MKSGSSENEDLCAARRDLETCLSVYSSQFRQGTNEVFSHTDKHTNLTAEQLMQELKRIASIVERSCVFSSNEEIDDVNTEDIFFILIPFVLGEISAHGNNMQNRLSHLQHAIIHFV